MTSRLDNGSLCWCLMFLIFGMCNPYCALGLAVGFLQGTRLRADSNTSDKLCTQVVRKIQQRAIAVLRAYNALNSPP